MAEIRAISVAAFTLARTCGEIAASILGKDNSDNVVDQVFWEIKDLEMVLIEVRKTIEYCGYEKIQSLTIEGYWSKLYLSLRDCEHTLDRIMLVVHSARRSGIRKTFWFTNRLDWDSPEIVLLRREINSQRNVMEISLQMITLHFILSVPANCF